MQLTHINQFTPDQSVVQGSARMSHHVTRGTLNGSTKSWICKAMGTAEDHAQRVSFMQKDSAQRELLAQEFFRLIIPHQPETRVALNPDSHDYFILSEEALAYRKLPKNEAFNFENGTYSGLGQALICAMFVEEIDLKNGNIGLDHQNRVIKIDGNLSFSSRAPGHRELYTMDNHLLSTLPYPTDFFTFNWLDYVKKRVRHQTSRIVDSTLKKSPQFRQEVNQAIFKIILLPDHLIEGLVSTCVLERGAEFIALIQSRRDRLLALATHDLSFQTYLSTPAALTDPQALIMHLLQFKAQGLSPILQSAEQEAELAGDIMDRMIDIRLHPQQGHRLIAQNRALLKEINTHRLPETDPLLDEFIDTTINEICNNTTNETALYITNSRLVTLLASLDSPEIIDVNQTVLQLASTPSSRDKANTIAAAFRTLPLAQRHRVISMPEANPVQQALARHRFFPHTGAVYLKGDAIDTNKAATAFKTLKKKYPQDVDRVDPRHAPP